MPVKKDANGQRSVESEAEVPGTPEEVWAAISTGPGVSSWFVPTTIEGREGGNITASFGPGMDSHAKITSWEPPRRFTAVNEGGMGPGSPTMATEWTVEARSGGTCRVRVVHRLEPPDAPGQLVGPRGGEASERHPAVLRFHLGIAHRVAPVAAVVVDDARVASTGSGRERHAAEHRFGHAPVRFVPLAHLHAPCQRAQLRIAQVTLVEMLLGNVAVRERHGDRVGHAVIGRFARFGLPFLRISCHEADRRREGFHVHLGDFVERGDVRG